MAEVQDAPAPPKFEAIEILNASEPWVDIFLADGSKLRLRLIITEVRKAIGVNNPDGTPLLQCGWQVITKVIGAPK